LGWEGGDVLGERQVIIKKGPRKKPHLNTKDITQKTQPKNTLGGREKVTWVRGRKGEIGRGV